MNYKENTPRKIYPLNKAIQKGIALDFLFSFTTQFNTTKNLSRQEIFSNYAHIEDIDKFIERLIKLQLLVEVVSYPEPGQWQPALQTNNLRLSHDILAPIIRYEYQRSKKEGQLAQSTLEQKAFLHATNKNYLLNKKELQLVHNGLPGMRRLNSYESDLLLQSKNAIKGQNFLRIGILTIAIGLILILFYQNIHPKLNLVSQDNNPLDFSIAPFGMALSKNGLFACAPNDTIFLIKEGKILETIEGLNNTKFLQFFKDDQYLIAVGIDDSTFFCWDLEKKIKAWELINPEGNAFTAVSINSDETQIILGDIKGKIWHTEIETKKLKNIPLPKKVWGRVQDIDFFDNQLKFVFCHRNGDCGIFNLDSPKMDVQYFNYPEGEFTNYNYIVALENCVVFAHYIGEPIAANHLTIFYPHTKTFQHLAQNANISYSQLYGIHNTPYVFTSDWEGIISLLHIKKEDKKIIEIMSDKVKFFPEGSIKGVINEENGKITVFSNKYIFLYDLKWVTFFNIQVPFGKYF